MRFLSFLIAFGIISPALASKVQSPDCKIVAYGQLIQIEQGNTENPRTSEIDWVNSEEIRTAFEAKGFAPNKVYDFKNLPNGTFYTSLRLVYGLEYGYPIALVAISLRQKDTSLENQNRVIATSDASQAAIFKSNSAKDAVKGAVAYAMKYMPSCVVKK